MSGKPSTDHSARHLIFGWWTLLVFLLLGLVLDALHGFKVAWYVNVDAETRRLMWTLAHAHGTLVAIVNIAFGLTLRVLHPEPAWVRRASVTMVGASVLLPAGFFLGGTVIHGGDPNPSAVLAAVGGLLLVAAVAWVATGLRTGVTAPGSARD